MYRYKVFKILPVLLVYMFPEMWRHIANEINILMLFIITVIIIIIIIIIIVICTNK